MTQIEIAASPETVRSVFLDWQRYKEWHQAWTFTTHDSTKQPADLKPGDGIKVDLKGTIINPVIVENSPNSFQWRGSLYGFFVGVHQFHFTPSETAPGNTTLVQKEDFGGPLSFLVRPGWSLAKQTQANFEVFNKDLKAAAEKMGR